MPVQTVIPVTDASQVGEARRAVARLAETAGFGQTPKGEAAIVATELANNLARYGQDGKLLLQLLPGAGGMGLEILAVDSGPGMADVQRCLQDGFSTGGTAGTGLGAVRRLAADFDVYSAVGSGTVVVARISGQARSVSSRKSSAFKWGTVSIPAPGETVCGDAWRVLERDGELSVIVADGLGHGPLANEASEQAACVFEAAAFAAPGASIEAAHRAISGTRGAAVAVAVASVQKQSISYSGVGNISGRLVSSSESRGLFSHNGTVGHRTLKIPQLDYPWPNHGVLVMHSDGLQGRWSMDNYPGLVMRHPAIVAGVLHRDFIRGKDDATVVVIQLNKI